MFLRSDKINRKYLVAEIVEQDHRTADVFRKHGIGYCCGGKWPMEIACEMRGIDTEKLEAELQVAVRTVSVPSAIDYTKWPLDFLMDYIINIHHHYLKETLPQTRELLHEFAIEHIKKYSYLAELEEQFNFLTKQILVSIQEAEEIIFPYIRKVLHAYERKEPYVALLVRTMGKPMENTLQKGHEVISDIVLAIRRITNTYSSPEKACIKHKVVLAKLKELDNDIVQLMYLERSVLFPRATAMEKEILADRS